MKTGKLEKAYTHRHTDTATQPHSHTATQLHRHTDMPTHQHTDTDTDTQTHRHTNTLPSNQALSWLYDKHTGNITRSLVYKTVISLTGGSNMGTITCTI